MKYESRIKKLIIEKFIKEHGYAPKTEKINELYFEKEKEYRGIEKYGFLGIEGKKYNFQETSSVKKENQNRAWMKEDIEYQRWISKEIDDSTKSLLKGHISNLNKVLKRLDTEELRVNNLLAMQGKFKFFSHALMESFENHNKVIFSDSTNHLIESGYATIKGVDLKGIDIRNKSIKVKFESSDKIVSENVVGDARNVAQHNGKSFNSIVEGNGQSDDVRCSLIIDLEEQQYVGAIKVFASPISRNDSTKYKVYYSTDGNNFNEVNSFKKVLDAGENFTRLGIDKVSKLKIELRKSKADENDRGRSIYYFNVDTIEVNKSKMEKNSKSEIILGPYEALDKEGLPINFSMATLSDSTCCIIPEMTSVNFFVSNDKENWKFIERNENSNSFARLGNLEYRPLNKNELGKDIFSFCEDDYDFIDNTNESLLNFWLLPEEFKSLNKDLIIIERNLLNTSERNSGWKSNGNSYHCNFYVDEIEGIVFDFGSTSCEIDDRIRTGRVHMPKGYHTFKTSYQNWKRVDLHLGNLEDFKEEDNLYPFNHKYIIEGYQYGRDFMGEKVYNGSTRVFEEKLNFLPEVKFNEMGKNNHFTLTQKESKLYVKVKIDSNDMNWKKHNNNVIIYKSENGSNRLYIKAVLETRKENVAPHINSISVKVI